MPAQADRRRRKVLWVTAALALLSVGIGVAWWGWPRDRGASLPVPPSEQPAGERPAGDVGQPAPQTEFRQSRLTGWYQGQKQWELQAKVVEVAEDGVHTRLEQIREGILYREGRPYLGFQSGTGVWDQSSGDLDLTGGVRVTYQGVTVFQTEQLHWVASTSRLVVPGRVVLDWQGQHLQADHLEGDLARQLLIATGQVVLQQQGQSLAAGWVELDLANGKIRAQGPASLELQL